MNKPQDSVAIIGSKETRCWRNNRYSDNNLRILWSILRNCSCTKNTV